MMPDVVNHLPAPHRTRFETAYNDKKRPIGWWDPDDVAVGIVQAWLFILGEKLPISVKEDADGSLTCDGVFGQETFDAVTKFQKRRHIKVDGMVGHDTLDEFRRAMRERIVQVDEPVFIHKPNEVTRPPRPCPPGTLICKDPDAP